MKAKRKTRATRRRAKAHREFAAHFTGYLLPPESICLYSEHRKFFLHGTLYCAIAASVGKTGKSRAALVRELSAKFPLAMVEEALRRLTDRNYLVAASPTTTGPVAGFWASIGLPPEIAKQNLDGCRVKIED